MNTDSIRQYLDMLTNAFTQRANTAEVYESDEGPVLLCTLGSPFDENAEIAYQISLQSIDEGFIAAEIMILMFADISEDKHKDIGILINRLNQFVTLGAFRLFADNGTLMLYQGMIFDEAMQTVKVTELILKTIQRMESTMIALGEFIDRALKGEDTDKLLADLQRRNDDGQDI